MHLQIESYMLHHYPFLEKFPTIIQKLIFKICAVFFHEKEINEFMEKNSSKDALGFVEAVVDFFDVKSVFSKQELEHIPSYGKVVIIANHPLGALDAMALIDIVKSVRKDIKIVANSFLNNIEQLQELLIPVDNINNKVDKNYINNIQKALDQNNALIIFPAGEVSRAKINGVRDSKWKNGFLKIANKSKAPILPVFIKAKNSKLFYILSSINKSLATATLPHEMFKFKSKTIVFKIGKVIPFESYHSLGLPQGQMIKIFRKHLYRVAKGKRDILKTQNNIALAEPKQDIKNALKQSELLGETSDNKQIYLYSTNKEDVVLNEIGRLREISFRFVGEGSGKKRDLDKYDLYYKHIILWDEESLEIAGAYRIAIGSEVLSSRGISGLYTSELFKFNEEFEQKIYEGIELGRSFVQPRFWGSRALDYLWQGIGAYVKKHPEARYLFGAVSMSDSFNSLAKAMMIAFYSNYFGSKTDEVLHKYPYTFTPQEREKCDSIFVYDDYKKDLTTLKEELGVMGFAIPTLYKQYSEVCEEGGVVFYDFGVDGEFGNCIDGFLSTDMTMLKEAKRKRYIGQ